MPRLPLFAVSLLATSPGIVSAQTFQDFVREAVIGHYRAHLAQYWAVPDDITPGVGCEIALRLSPAGAIEVLDLSACQEDLRLQGAVVSALGRAVPLPVPENTPEELRRVRLRFGTR